VNIASRRCAGVGWNNFGRARQWEIAQWSEERSEPCDESVVCVSSCCDVVVLNVCGRVRLALGQASSSSGLFWFGQASASAASGTFPRWTLHCGAVSAPCELDLSTGWPRETLHVTCIWPPLRRISLLTPISDHNVHHKQLKANILLATKLPLSILHTFDTATTIQHYPRLPSDV
jgi:hypothetical protein